jgi:hypothetical protein
MVHKGNGSSVSAFIDGNLVTSVHGGKHNKKQNHQKSINPGITYYPGVNFLGAPKKSSLEIKVRSLSKN